MPMPSLVDLCHSHSSLLEGIVAVFALVVRAAVGLHGYSGEATPPRFGDFEAQRHWMEITLNLPPSAWYVQGKDNDLNYWGLDYPPCAAYLAWAVGIIARVLHPELVALHASRGHESPETRAFMRNSVLAIDVLVFFSAARAFAHLALPRDAARRHRWTLLVALCPPLVLVDHGHFQYNCVSLGLSLWAAVFALRGQPRRCCVAFSLSLNSKQMGLYFAPAFFCYLLAGCFTPRSAAARGRAFLSLAATTIATFAVCWAPFLTDANVFVGVLRRIFPTSRSLYEDKVANVWCTLALLPGLKLKQLLPVSALLRLALSTTALLLLPPCAMLLRRPSRVAFLLALFSGAQAFFLASFQVHEKHILLPLLPALLLAPALPLLYAWYAATAAFSMFPLLSRDGQRLPYALLQCAALAVAAAHARGAQPSPAAQKQHAAGATFSVLGKSTATLQQYLMCASLSGMVILHAAEALVSPPARYPDLHAVAFSAYACAHFALAYAASVIMQWRLSRIEPTCTPFTSDRLPSQMFEQRVLKHD